MRSVIIATLLNVLCVSQISALDLEDIESVDIEHLSLYTLVPSFNLLGFTSNDTVDLFYGFDEGVFGEDVRTEINECVMQAPKIGVKFYEIVDKDDLLTVAGMLKFFTDTKSLMQIFNMIMDLVKDGPEEFQACTNVWTQGSGLVGWVIKHLNPSALLTNIIGNLTTNIA